MRQLEQVLKNIEKKIENTPKLREAREGSIEAEIRKIYKDLAELAKRV